MYDASLDNARHVVKQMSLVQSMTTQVPTLAMRFACPSIQELDVFKRAANKSRSFTVSTRTIGMSHKD